MANLEVSSALVEVSVSITGVMEVASALVESSVAFGEGIEISSALLEISTIIPNGELAVASVLAEVSIAFPQAGGFSVQGENMRKQLFVEGSRLTPNG